MSLEMMIERNAQLLRRLKEDNAQLLRRLKEDSTNREKMIREDKSGKALRDLAEQMRSDKAWRDSAEQMRKHVIRREEEERRENVRRMRALEEDAHEKKETKKIQEMFLKRYRDEIAILQGKVTRTTVELQVRLSLDAEKERGAADMTQRRVRGAARYEEKYLRTRKVHWLPSEPPWMVPPEPPDLLRTGEREAKGKHLRWKRELKQGAHLEKEEGGAKRRREEK